MGNHKLRGLFNFAYTPAFGPAYRQAGTPPKIGGELFGHKQLPPWLRRG